MGAPIRKSTITFVDTDEKLVVNNVMRTNVEDSAIRIDCNDNSSIIIPTARIKLIKIVEE